MTAFVIGLLDISISACFIICAVLLLRLFLRRSPAYIRCLLWALVGLRLIMPFSIESNLSLVPISAPVTNYVEQVTDTEVHLPPAKEESSISEPSPSVPSVPSPPTESDKEDVPMAENTAVEKRIPWGFYLWGAGIAAMLVYMGVSLWRLRGKLKNAVILNDKVRVFKGTGSPFVSGIVKPRLYLPTGFDEKQMEHIISHESAHVKRLDHIFKPFAFCILALHWFNPLAWVAYFMFCKDMELACDEKVVAKMDAEERKQYSLTLLSCSTGRFSLASPLAFGERAIKERVSKVMNYKKPSFWIIIVSVLALIVTAVLFITNPKTDEEEEQSGETSMESTDETTEEPEELTFKAEAIESLPETGINIHVYTDPFETTDKVLISANMTVTDFAYVELIHGEISGYHLGTKLFSLPEFTADTKLCVKTALMKEVSDRGITFTDENGNKKVFALLCNEEGPYLKDINTKEHSFINMAGMKAEVGNLFADKPLDCSEPDGTRFLKISVTKEVKEFTFFKLGFHSSIGTVPGDVYCEGQTLTPSKPFYAKLNIGNSTHGFSAKDDTGRIRYYSICSNSSKGYYFWDITKEAERLTELQNAPPVEPTPEYEGVDLLPDHTTIFGDFTFTFANNKEFLDWVEGRSEKMIAVDSYEYGVFSIYDYELIERYRSWFTKDGIVGLLSMDNGLMPHGKIVCSINENWTPHHIKIEFSYRNSDGERITLEITQTEEPIKESISEYWEGETNLLESCRFEKRYVKTKTPVNFNMDVYIDEVEMALLKTDTSWVRFIFRGAFFSLKNHHGDFTENELNGIIFSPPYSWG